MVSSTGLRSRRASSSIPRYLQEPKEGKDKHDRRKKNEKICTGKGRDTNGQTNKAHAVGREWVQVEKGWQSKNVPPKKNDASRVHLGSALSLHTEDFHPIFKDSWQLLEHFLVAVNFNSPAIEGQLMSFLGSICNHPVRSRSSSQRGSKLSLAPVFYAHPWKELQKALTLHSLFNVLLCRHYLLSFCSTAVAAEVRMCNCILLDQCRGRRSSVLPPAPLCTPECAEGEPSWSLFRETQENGAHREKAHGQSIGQETHWNLRKERFLGAFASAMVIYIR